jgi:hypothetical protein
MPAANKHVTTFTTPADTDVVVTRTFDAPRALVFEAHTSCKHMPNWMGPYGWTMSECKNDLRPGGEFRYTWSKPGGGGITITGVNNRQHGVLGRTLAGLDEHDGVHRSRRPDHARDDDSLSVEGSPRYGVRHGHEGRHDDRL